MVTSAELTAGDYYLLETQPPAGYTPITDKIGVTVTAGEITEKTVYNTSIPVEPPQPTTGRIQLIKKAEGSNKPLKDAVFGVYTALGDIKVAELPSRVRTVRQRARN